MEEEKEPISLGGEIPPHSKLAYEEFVESSTGIEFQPLTAPKSSSSFSFFQAIHSQNRQISAFL